jgi:hypothetical protein
MKNAFSIAAFALALAACTTTTTTTTSSTSPIAPPNCVSGTHQVYDYCVQNSSAPHPTHFTVLSTQWSCTHGSVMNDGRIIGGNCTAIAIVRNDGNPGYGTVKFTPSGQQNSCTAIVPLTDYGQAVQVSCQISGGTGYTDIPPVAVATP